MGLLYDAKAIAKRDPAARNILEVILLYSGFHALIYYRISKLFYKLKLKFLARLVSQLGRSFTGIEIHPGARIGKGLFIDHGMGVVIGETAVIGDNCTIYHGVTLGGNGKVKGKKRHPTIGDNVLVGAGAKILGPFYVGNNVLIGANAVVLGEVPPETTVVGVPARHTIKHDRGRPSEELDQVHTSDPLSQEICRLQARLERLEKSLDIQKEEKK
jgi:serine O-acetyltransferase